ncbi:MULTISPECIES: hypothetical protein [unclassified Moorena]|nr:MULTISPECIES: hypothetical protein [unclassified Moorena]
MINRKVGSAYQGALSADLICIKHCPPYMNFSVPCSLFPIP